MKLITSLLILVFPTMALAAGGHGGEGVPRVTLYQLINLVVLFGGLIYFGRTSIVEYFASRKTAFVEASQKAAAARAQAEKDFAEIKNKLQDLESTHAQSIAKVEAQAEELKMQMAQDAQALSARIRDDAKLTVSLELKRAQNELRQQLLEDSMRAARMLVTKDLSSTDQQKLQKDFISQVGV